MPPRRPRASPPPPRRRTAEGGAGVLSVLSDATDEPERGGCDAAAPQEDRGSRCRADAPRRRRCRRRQARGRPEAAASFAHLAAAAALQDGLGGRHRAHRRCRHRRLDRQARETPRRRARRHCAAGAPGGTPPPGRAGETPLRHPRASPPPVHASRIPPRAPRILLSVGGSARPHPRVPCSTGRLRRRGQRRGATRARTIRPPPRRSARVRLPGRVSSSPETVVSYR